MSLQQLNQYLEQFVAKSLEEIKKLEQYAEIHDVPIMESAGIEAMLQMLSLHKPKRILEIGAAIGYPAIRMATFLPDVTVVTIERDEERYNEAVKNIHHFGLENRIRIIFGDALEVEGEIRELGPYDVLFIDAAKGQYKKFFELYEPMITSDSLILTDNVLFKGFVTEDPEQIDSKGLKGLVKKIRGYNEWLTSHPNYHTVIYPIGDGLAVSKRRG